MNNGVTYDPNHEYKAMFHIEAPDGYKAGVESIKNVWIADYVRVYNRFCELANEEEIRKINEDFDKKSLKIGYDKYFCERMIPYVEEAKKVSTANVAGMVDYYPAVRNGQYIGLESRLSIIGATMYFTIR